MDLPKPLVIEILLYLNFEEIDELSSLYNDIINSDNFWRKKLLVDYNIDTSDNSYSKYLELYKVNLNSMYQKIYDNLDYYIKLAIGNGNYRLFRYYAERKDLKFPNDYLRHYGQLAINSKIPSITLYIGINMDKKELMYDLARAGYLEETIKLLNKYPNYNSTFLKECVTGNLLDLVRSLLNNKTEDDISETFTGAGELGNISFLNELNLQYPGNLKYVLDGTINADNDNVIQYIYDNSESLHNKDEITNLFYRAIGLVQPKIAKWCIKYGYIIEDDKVIENLFKYKENYSEDKIEELLDILVENGFRDFSELINKGLLEYIDKYKNVWDDSTLLYVSVINYDINTIDKILNNNINIKYSLNYIIKNKVDIEFHISKYLLDEEKLYLDLLDKIVKYASIEQVNYVLDQYINDEYYPYVNVVEILLKKSTINNTSLLAIIFRKEKIEKKLVELLIEYGANLKEAFKDAKNYTDYLDDIIDMFPELN